IGIDFSGGKIKDAAIAHRGAVRARCRPPVPADEHRGAIAAMIARVAASEPEIGGAAAVGMSATEAISPAAGPSNNADSTYLRGGAPQQDLPSALGRRARLAKTASCFALSQV